MKWYQSLARWTLLAAVGLLGIGYLANGLSGDGRSTQPPPIPKASTASETADWMEVVADVDAEFETTWNRESLSRAPAADWQTVSRRISLALIGSSISLEDMRWLESLPEGTQVDALTERLLADHRFADYWAERLGRAYVGADIGPFIVYRRRRFITWLSQQLHDRVPYSQIVRKLITAKGIWTENPQVNFLTVTLDTTEKGRVDPVRLAARTSRAFLGMRIDCLQCHDDFLGNVTLGTNSDPLEGTQRDFHHLAAFYSTAANSIQGIRDDGKTYEYQFLYEDETEEVEPIVPFLPELLTTDSAAEKLPSRQQLARWVTHPENIPAARAAVNRVWALMFGKPLSDPVDDIPLHGPFPAGLDRLAHDFAEHDWDLRRLIRIISHLQTFQLDSRCDFEVTSEHEQAWAVYPLIRLRPEQVASSIIQSCRLATLDRQSALLVQLQAFGEKNDFINRYGDTGEDEFGQDAITITQRLLAMNGKLVNERTGENPFMNASSQIAMFATDDAHAVEITYLSILNRRPTDEEAAALVRQSEQGVSRRQFVEDLYWILINSSEFSWNH